MQAEQFQKCKCDTYKNTPCEKSAPPTEDSKHCLKQEIKLINISQDEINVREI